MPYRSSSSRSSRGELRMVRRSDNTISYGRSRRDSLATERYSVRVDLPRIPNVFTPLKSLLYSEPRVVVKPERSYTDYPTRRYCYARSEMPTYSSKTASSSQRPVTIHGYRRPSVLLS
ncbi:hypothetical protein AJ80_09472 [Polytolypa hystricis UAMH7299]|uniref:Uncharacterized protein n=1 Tax=Polytolypa hystricis (strain UAMH7299) TaxID=1447883 RepID=A0A2B7WQD0_POLH7|nr:hypothetical protein AJ80_09472 [Polytolypa hystricis UAMH7299]